MTNDNTDRDQSPQHSASLSWRDVYTAVGQMEERMTKVLERIEAKFDNVSGDHEMRIRALEVSGSIEAQEALRTARALGIKVDAISAKVDTNTAFRQGSWQTLGWGPKVILFGISVIGGAAVLLDIISKYAG